MKKKTAPSISRKQFLAAGCAAVATAALGAACAGGDGDGGYGGGGYGDDDDSYTTPFPSPSPSASPSPTPTSSPTPTPSPTPFGDCMANGANAAAISANHLHELVVPAADVTAGVEKDYSIQGASPHDHMVTLTAAHFTQLQMNFQVVVQSGPGGGGHTHQVTVRCL